MFCSRSRNRNIFSENIIFPSSKVRNYIEILLAVVRAGTCSYSVTHGKQKVKSPGKSDIISCDLMYRSIPRNISNCVFFLFSGAAISPVKTNSIKEQRLFYTKFSRFKSVASGVTV